MALIVEQLLNAIQLGVMLFLLAAGLTLIFGIMGVLNLAHGSLYMIGAYATAAVAAADRLVCVGRARPASRPLPSPACSIELLIIRRLYDRDHLDQVLATFGLILLVNESTVLLFGRQPMFVSLPAAAQHIGPDFSRRALSGLSPADHRRRACSSPSGFICSSARTKLGMLIRAGATHRDIVQALGVDIRKLYTAVFGLGALLAGLAGLMMGPLTAVQVGMGEQILIQTFVVVVIGGIGSIRGAFFGALLVGIVDTMLRAFVPGLLRGVMSIADADALGAGLSSMGVYLLMALVLLIKPKGLFPAHG